VVEHGRSLRVMFFAVVAVVFVVVLLAVWANARSRRQLEALNENPDDMKRAGVNEQPPSSSGYLGPVG
jgi:ABC-type branched-subunit amino acid transport system permease subunit